MSEPSQAPFSYFGGKSRVAHIVWQRFGAVRNYVEPFAGSLAVPLLRPAEYSLDNQVETFNDKDAAVTNAWRAIALRPDETSQWADSPVHEIDLHARHIWCRNRLVDVRGIDDEILARAIERGLLPFAARLEQDPLYCDPQLAGWWIWGMCTWIGGGWCNVNFRRLPHLGDAGRGINRQRPHLGDAGKGVHRRLPHLGDAGRGECERHRDAITTWFHALSDRLRHARFCCGDFERVLGPSVTVRHGTTAVFLDPPYSQDCGVDTVYNNHDASVSARAREWALANAGDPRLRIALCGYADEHAMPADWECVAWKTQGGYGNQSDGRGRANCHRERIWFSPHCLRPAQSLAHFSEVSDSERRIK